LARPLILRSPEEGVFVSSVFGHTLSITGFVFVMMLLIEYVNVFSRGLWRDDLARNRWGQYLVAALLGVTPGCLGAFMVVGMYSHRLLSLGALVTAMIATSGDEAFVMFALMPRQAVLLSLGLLVLGILAGAITDVFARDRTGGCIGLQVHDQEQCHCFDHGRILHQLKDMSLIRGILVAILAALIVAVGTGLIGPSEWNWIRLTVMTLTIISLLIVGTVPEHASDFRLDLRDSPAHAHPDGVPATGGVDPRKSLGRPGDRMSGRSDTRIGTPSGFPDTLCPGFRTVEHSAGQFDRPGRPWHVAPVGALEAGFRPDKTNQFDGRPGCWGVGSLVGILTHSPLRILPRAQPQEEGKTE